jgi:glycerol-3-phosphate dehydrogenase
MKRDLQRFQNQVFDVLVLGGGVSGASIAWDAVLRGLSVALIERADFGHATSASTSKLIHGGLRYLAQGDIPVVRESLRERRYLEINMPHQVFSDAVSDAVLRLYAHPALDARRRANLIRRACMG